MSASWVTMMTVWPGGMELGEDLHDLLAGGAVEVAGRLVGQQDGGLVHQRAGDRDPLALAARELVRAVVHPVRRGRPASSAAPRALAALARADPGVDQRQLHVVQRGGAGEQVEGLEHEADLPVPHPRQRVVGETGNFLRR